MHPCNLKGWLRMGVWMLQGLTANKTVLCVLVRCRVSGATCVSLLLRCAACAPFWWGVCGVSWVLCENCIVDASIFLFCEVCVCLGSRARVVSSCCELVYVVMLACLFLLGCVGVVCVTGVWWMPWHAGPMKDV